MQACTWCLCASYICTSSLSIERRWHGSGEGKVAGGDEFVLVLIDTGAADALLVAERIRAEVEASSATACWPLVTTAWPARPGSRDGAGRSPTPSRTTRRTTVSTVLPRIF